MSIEAIIAILIVLGLGYLAFKILKKIVVALITMGLIIVLIAVGIFFLLSKDIQSFKNHPTKKLLLVITSDDGQKIEAAAAFSPQIGHKLMKTKVKEKSKQKETSGEATGKSNNFEILKGRRFKKIQKEIIASQYSDLLKQYFKIVLFKTKSIDYLISASVTVFDLSFTPTEIKQIIIDKHPQKLLFKKSIHSENVSMKKLFKVFNSDSELKAGIFFGSLFDSIRKDNVSVLIGLIKSFHNDVITIKDETIIFKLIKISPISLAKTLLESAQKAFSQGKMKLPDFGRKLADINNS